eukprot:TRINITY_DN76950_c0_g1_i1.p1 TRINITY_DN76950_c0_g1~~TRINITY_DN76950_c0_g1_i1.p1  ORF type:complete len:261 (+),score=23.87 TRINITY_DN76950_c0_g1_i1:111-785(+)
MQALSMFSLNSFHIQPLGNCPSHRQNRRGDLCGKLCCSAFVVLVASQALSHMLPLALAVMPGPRMRLNAVYASGSTVLAPTRPTTASPGMPLGTDPRRFGESVRWLLDEDAKRPPFWHVLLLGKTFQTSGNTVHHVAASLMVELPLVLDEARRKSVHARDHFFSVVHTTPSWEEAISIAKRLQLKSLVVRVVPGFASDGADDARKDEDVTSSVTGSGQSFSAQQ